MGYIITPTLPHDLPENWNENQYVSPGGTEAGLTKQHGYNYLMKQVNDVQKAVVELDEHTDTERLTIEIVKDRALLLESMLMSNDFIAPICTDDGPAFSVMDDLGNVIVADWFFQTEPIETPETRQQVVQTGIQMELLWENASPTSEFAAQTISLDLSGYDFVELACLQETSYTSSVFRERIECAEGKEGLVFFHNNVNIYYRRSFKITNLSSFFVNACEKYTGSATTANSYVIPWRIYGIKGVS